MNPKYSSPSIRRAEPPIPESIQPMDIHTSAQKEISSDTFDSHIAIEAEKQEHGKKQVEI